MTQDEIIRMAREVGLPHWYHNGEPVNVELLERFAAIVAENTGIEQQREIVRLKGIIEEQANGAQNLVAAHEREKQAEQEPVAWGCRFQDGSIHDCICPESHAECEGDYNIPLYAAPVRTKDLTDDEIRFWIGRFPFLLNEESEKWVIGFARVIIAADREKNK